MNVQPKGEPAAMVPATIQMPKARIPTEIKNENAAFMITPQGDFARTTDVALFGRCQQRQLFAFDVDRLNGVLVGQLSQLYLRFGITNIVGVPPAFLGLISQIDGAFGHKGTCFRSP
jgi:hypothetical protein